MRTSSPLRPPVRLRFTPVAVAVRHDGWTPAKLRARAGAESFARAWDRAVGIGRCNARDHAISRALNGEWQPVIRLGRTIGWKHSFNTKLLIAAMKYPVNQQDRAKNHANRKREAP